jgi:RND superfamily putative drug exporter
MRPEEGHDMRRLGRLATRRRWWVITLAMLFVPTAALPGGSTEDRLSAGGLDDPGSEASRAASLLARDFNTGAPNLLLLVSARSGSVDRPAAAAAGLALARRLGAEPAVAEAVSYWSTAAPPPSQSRRFPGAGARPPCR